MIDCCNWSACVVVANNSIKEVIFVFYLLINDEMYFHVNEFL